MAKVFISYVREDEAIAQKIHDYLKAEGHDIWIDQEKLIPGQDWKQEIQKAINSNDVFIACLSSNSIKKQGYSHKELKTALDFADQKPEGEIYIIPIRLDECEIPLSLQNKHCVDYFKKDSMKNILRAITSKEKEGKAPIKKRASNEVIHASFIKENINSIIFNSRLLCEDKYPQIATQKALAKLRDIDKRLSHIDYKNPFNNAEFAKQRIHEFNEVTGFEFSENDINLIDYLLFRPEQLAVWLMFDLVYRDNSETEWQTYKGYFESYYIANFSTDDLKAREADLWLLEKAKRFYEIVKKNIQGVEPKPYYETLDLSDFE